MFFVVCVFWFGVDCVNCMCVCVCVCYLRLWFVCFMFLFFVCGLYVFSEGFVLSCVCLVCFDMCECRWCVCELVL